MTNAYYAEDKMGLGGNSTKPPSPALKRGNSASFKEKPGFSFKGTAGKSQPKNRSAGVNRVKTYADSEGL